MSFFGFDTSGHNAGATGFSQPHDPFAGLSNRDAHGEALEFEDTYDGLGDQLDETDDAFNDDTFGGGPSIAGGGAVGKDFDFFGQTAKVADAIEEEHVRFSRQQPAAKIAPSTVQAPAYTHSYNYNQQTLSRPVRTGYEKYKEGPVDELQVDAALWGVAPKKQATPVGFSQSVGSSQPVGFSQPQPSAPARKILSLEEVEAQMRSQVKKPPQPAAPSPAPQLQPPQIFQQSFIQPAASIHQHQVHIDSSFRFPSTEPFQQHVPSPNETPQPKEQPSHTHGHPVTILQRPQSKATPPSQPIVHTPSQPSVHHRQQHSANIQPVHILQNPNRHSADVSIRAGISMQMTPPLQPIHSNHAGHRQQGSFSHQAQIITHPSQLSQLSEDEKVQYLEQEARRAKRNHKIFVMSRDNGIMTPSDKNFVTRIQLQQLVSAAGNPNEHGTDESLNEDFYYQVHSQIQGVQRQHPSQPLSNFAQTYLFQTGNRHGGMRRHHRGPENHMQRMEQQVQRAVEAAKNKPKNKQLVIEGSLGKISFSNAKTPKPLLNIKRTESSGDAQRSNAPSKGSQVVHGRDAKRELRSIEAIFELLMKMEDHERAKPPQPVPESEPEAIQAWVDWGEEYNRLNKKMWASLRIHDHPADDFTLHPFIALLSYKKGMKVIPRVFRQIDFEQRTTILTLIAINLDKLDVVRNGQVDTGNLELNSSMRDLIDTFSVMVTSTLFTFMNDMDLDLISGILGLVCGRNVDIIAKSRIGASILTMLLSRAEIIKHGNGGSEQSWRSWDATFVGLFNSIEGSLPYVFPGAVNTGDDVYVWQLLAALGIHASPDQQKRLVMAVKDRVMATIDNAKTLPAEMSRERLANVNLFMRSIGLDVELLQ